MPRHVHRRLTRHRRLDPETSDIDYVVITHHELDVKREQALCAAHARITATPSKWATKLEGLYIPRDTLRTRHLSTQRCAYLGVGGRFTTGGCSNDWIIQLHLIREHGIILMGPAPTTLIDPISPQDLRASCAAIMHDWEPLLHTEKFDDEYQAYTILTMCRMLYTLEHSSIASKPVAALWAAERFPRWSPLIERARTWRPTREMNAREDSLAMLRFTIDASQLAPN